MNLSYIQRNNSPRLLLIYSGWSVDASAFANLTCPGYDIAVAWDYSELTPLEPAGDYGEVVLIAWSLGVHAAELTARKLPLTLTVAVNGTPSPVSDTEGIPVHIYDATARNLSEQTLLKFRRRVGGSHLARGERPISSLKTELLNFPTGPADFRWDRAVISGSDMIFPPQNQRMAWNGRTEISEIEGPHLVDFQKIIDAYVINKPLVGKRFGAHHASYDGEADVQHRIADHLFELWQKHGLNHAGSVLEIGVGSGYFTQCYRRRLKNAEIDLWDIAPADDSVTAADAEVELSKLTRCYDVIASASTMQWFNSQAAFLKQCCRVLNPGGLAVISTFGPRTFAELTEAGVIPLPYLSMESLRRIIPDEFEILELHQGLITKTFPTPTDALRHLQATGVNARKAVCPLRELISRYPRRDDGRFGLTFQPIYLILRKK